MNLKPLWTIAHGAAKFTAAWLTGDVAPKPERDHRRSVCLGCPDRQRVKIAGSDGLSDWCGPPLTETTRTCGCLIAGKISVASEACPQNRWIPCVPLTINCEAA